MTTPRVLVHTSIQAIRWADMDAFDHVNNIVYFRYMEQARIEWVYAQAKAVGHTGNDGPVIVNASCNCLLPLVYPGEIEVLMYLGPPGRSSVDSLRDFCRGKKIRGRRREDRVDRPRLPLDPLARADGRAAARPFRLSDR